MSLVIYIHRSPALSADGQLGSDYYPAKFVATGRKVGWWDATDHALADLKQAIAAWGVGVSSLFVSGLGSGSIPWEFTVTINAACSSPTADIANWIRLGMGDAGFENAAVRLVSAPGCSPTPANTVYQAGNLATVTVHTGDTPGTTPKPPGNPPPDDSAKWWKDNAVTVALGALCLAAAVAK